MSFSGDVRLLRMLLLAALLLFSADVGRLLTYDGDDEPAPPAAVTTPTTTGTTTTGTGTGTVSAPPVVPAAAPVGTGEPGTTPTQSGTQAGSDVVLPPPPVATPSTDAPDPSAPPVVVCKEDPVLEDSPDAPFDFFCMSGGQPVTWATRNVTLHASGLDAVQTSALQLALAQWQTQGDFVVTQVASAAGADITIEPSALESSEGGYTSIRYTCTDTCAFDHAAMQLSSSLSLTQTVWIPIILHELGHVAGLSHVARDSEVMYPILGLESPVAYGAGDIAGLQALADARDT